jgi:hypothetical protein
VAGFKTAIYQQDGAGGSTTASLLRCEVIEPVGFGPHAAQRLTLTGDELWSVKQSSNSLGGVVCRHKLGSTTFYHKIRRRGNLLKHKDCQKVFRQNGLSKLETIDKINACCADDH